MPLCKIFSAVFKRADKIIAVSEATKKDIVSLLSIDASRITAILNGGGTASI